MNAELIKQGIPQSDRLKRLNTMAIEQLTTLIGNSGVKLLESQKGGADK